MVLTRCWLTSGESTIPVELNECSDLDQSMSRHVCCLCNTRTLTRVNEVASHERERGRPLPSCFIMPTHEQTAYILQVATICSEPSNGRTKVFSSRRAVTGISLQCAVSQRIHSRFVVTNSNFKPSHPPLHIVVFP